MNLIVFPLAALCEILGCFAFFAVIRQKASPLWLMPGVLSLIIFAGLLTFSPSEQAGRSFAAYGGVYIAASLLWLWLVERQRPDAFDLSGAALCLVGAAVILWPR